MITKNLPLCFVLVIFLALLILPIAVTAQTGTLYQEGPSESGTMRHQYVHGWQQSNGLQQKISALPSTANPVVLMPVLFGVGVANISPNFGDPRSGGRTHEGEDIMAVKGTPIVSPTSAVVIRTGVGATEGNYVYTANSGGEVFVYMHLDRIGEGVTSGTVLAQGGLIGYVGNTGNASGGPAHLHFEIHNSSGTPVDPFPRLTGELSLQEKISDLSTILAQTSDPATLSQFLVTNFRSTFTSALALNISLPVSIKNLLTPNPSSPTSGSGTLILSRNLYQGISGDDVRALQKLLNAKGYLISSAGQAGSSGFETNYFGAATQSAIIRFQIAKNISPAVGYVGPITRAALALL